MRDHPMQYIQVTCWYAPSFGFGGPVRLLADYAHWMVSAGIPTAVLTGNFHHDDTCLPAGLDHDRTTPIWRFRVWGTWFAKRAIYILSPALFVRLFGLIRSERDIVCLHFFDYRGLIPIACMLLKWCFPSRVRLVHSAFGTLHYKKSWLRSTYDLLILRMQLRALDVALAQNEHEQHVYAELLAGAGSAGRVEMIPLHTDAAAGFVSDRRAGLVLRRELGIEDDAVLLLFLGRFHPEKGMDRVLDVLSGLLQRGVKARLLLVGRDHGHLPAIRKRVESENLAASVHWFFNVSDRRFEFYAAADVFLGLPTIYEETMLAAVEALSCSTPVVVSREADMPHVQADGAGYVIDYDVQTAIDCVLDIATNADAYRQAAGRVARAHYDPDAVSGRLTRIVKGMAECGASMPARGSG